MVSSPNLTLSPLQCSFSGSLDRNCSCNQEPLVVTARGPRLALLPGPWIIAVTWKPPSQASVQPTLLALPPGSCSWVAPSSPPWVPSSAPSAQSLPPPSGLSIGFSPAPLPHPADVKVWDLQAPPCPPLCPAATFMPQERSQWLQIHHSYSELGGWDGKAHATGEQGGWGGQPPTSSPAPTGVSKQRLRAEKPMD